MPCMPGSRRVIWMLELARSTSGSADHLLAHCSVRTALWFRHRRVRWGMALSAGVVVFLSWV